MHGQCVPIQTTKSFLLLFFKKMLPFLFLALLAADQFDPLAAYAERNLAGFKGLRIRAE